MKKALIIGFIDQDRSYLAEFYLIKVMKILKQLFYLLTVQECKKGLLLIVLITIMAMIFTR